MKTTNFLLYALFLFLGCGIFLQCKQPEKPLTDEQIKDFIQKVESSFAKRDPSYLNNALDKKEIIKRSAITGKNSSSLKAGMESGLMFGTSLISSLSDKAIYQSVKQYEKDGVHHALFRTYDQGAINYHDYELESEGGACKVADIYIYMTGQTFSESLSSIFGQFKEEMANKSAPSKETEQWMKALTQARVYLTQGNYESAKASFDKIPANYKKEKIFRVLAIEIAAGLSNEEYLQAISDFEAAYPGDPSLSLISIDGYFLRNQYDKALESVNQLDEQVGKDPILDYYRSICYSKMDEPEKSKECLLRLTKNLPDFEDGALELIATYTKEGEHDLAKPLIESYRKHTDFNQDNLETILKYYKATE